jgi:hypothetical protein
MPAGKGLQAVYATCGALLRCHSYNIRQQPPVLITLWCNNATTRYTFGISLTAAAMKQHLLNLKSIVMKKLQTILAALTLLVATSAFAANGPEKVSAVVKKAFEQQFNNASNVSWEKSDDFYFASFKLNDKNVSVAYNEAGELVGASRVITAAELPLSVSLAIKEKYKDYSMANTASEITYEGQTSYTITVENSKQVLNLKCLSNGDISVVSKNKK